MMTQSNYFWMGMTGLAILGLGLMNTIHAQPMPSTIGPMGTGVQTTTEGTMNTTGSTNINNQMQGTTTSGMGTGATTTNAGMDATSGMSAQQWQNSADVQSNFETYLRSPVGKREGRGLAAGSEGVVYSTVQTSNGSIPVIVRPASAGYDMAPASGSMMQ